MPYKDKEKQRLYDKERQRKHTAYVALRRKEDPEFAERERAASRKWYREYASKDPVWKRQQILKRTVNRHSMTIEKYNELLNIQNHACAICKIPHIEENKGRLHVDHDHVIGFSAVRGLLCTRCNSGLGFFKDNPTLLRLAAEYLERHK